MAMNVEDLKEVMKERFDLVQKALESLNENDKANSKEHSVIREQLILLNKTVGDHIKVEQETKRQRKGLVYTVIAGMILSCIAIFKDFAIKTLSKL